MPLIFQYGSNTNTQELYGRLGSQPPDLGRAETVERLRMAFNKRSINRRCATADMIGPDSEGVRIWGVLYEVTEEELEKLANEIEGPSYRQEDIAVSDREGKSKSAKTFVVREEKHRNGLWTSAEYVGHIVKGLRDHDVPEEYVQHVIDVAVRTNAEAEERQSASQQAELIEQLRNR